MSLPTSFDGVAELARRLKLDQVTDHGADPNEEASDLLPFVVVVRDGREVGLVYSGSGPDGARLAVYWAAALMRPHEIFLVADSRMRNVPPGEDLDSIEQGDIARDWRAGKREDTYEAMLVHRYPVMGPSTFAIYPYERNGRRLRWRDRVAPEGASMDGAIPDYARRGYNDGRANLSKMMPDLKAGAEALGLSPPAREQHLDRALGRFCSERTGPVVLFDTKGGTGHLEPSVTFVGGEER